MKLAIFDDYRLGVVSDDETRIVDVSNALPWPHDRDPFGAGWWLRLCREFATLRAAIQSAVPTARSFPIDQVRLRAPVLNPGKIVAAASNYAAHRAEMVAIQERVGRDTAAGPSEFDVFLKAPSSIVGPHEPVVLPDDPVAQGREIHHESELALVIGTGGARIAASDALDHVLGYTIALDMTVRGPGDRSRRKSYDTFTPVGPWLTTADEVGDPHELEIRLSIGGRVRQSTRASDMLTRIPAIIAYASSVMRLESGDLILTGAPPGVGEVHAGDVMDASISRLGSMRVAVTHPVPV